MPRILRLTYVPIVLALVAGSVLIAGPAEALPSTFSSGDFEYSVNGDGASVTVIAWDTTGSTDVHIPATATDGVTTFAVTAIGDNAFENDQTGVSLTSVVIPNSVTTIGDHAFYGNTSLASLDLGDGIQTIGDYAFSGVDYEDQNPANEIPSIVIPDSVETIGEGAFAGDLSVTSLSLGSGVTTIGAKAFLFDSLTSVSIPDSVVSIGASAFYYNSITSVVIGNHIATIGASAFADNDNLASVTFAADAPTIQPAGATGSFGTGGDENSVPLVINYDSGATGFSDPWQGYHTQELSDDFTFALVNGSATITAYTGSDTQIEIPSIAIIGGSVYAVTGIGEDAFLGHGITDVDIPDSVTSIAATAFFSNFITSVTIPDSVTTIGNSAFACNHITSVKLGSGLVHIGESAFACNQLTTVTVPKSVTKIGDGAFSDNPITSGIFNGDAPNMTPDQDIGGFGDPAGVTVYYYAGANGFTNPWYGYETREIGAASSSFDVAPSGPLAANGSAAYHATVTVRDNTHALVVGVPVAFTVPDGLSASDTTCTTGGDGSCSITLTSTSVGTYRLSATIGADPQALTASAVFAKASSTTGPTSVDALAFTGEDAGIPLVLGGGLAVVGMVLLALAFIRRRRATI